MIGTARLEGALWGAFAASASTDELRQACRALARRRALLAAASSLVPVPGVDLVADLALLTRLIGRINDHFGLSEAQLARLSPARQALAYRLLTGAGGTLARRLTTPVLIGRLLRLAGIRLTAMEAARLVPLAGQLAAAGIGYWTFRTLALRHIAQCERIAAALNAAPASEPGVSPCA